MFGYENQFLYSPGPKRSLTACSNIYILQGVNYGSSLGTVGPTTPTIIDLYYHFHTIHLVKDKLIWIRITFIPGLDEFFAQIFAWRDYD